MAIEYLKKVKSFAKWLIPFFMALFLMFGCGPSQMGQGSAETAAEVQLETEQSQAAEVQSETEQSQAAEVQSETEQSQAAEVQSETEQQPEEREITVVEDGSYISKEEVALYLHTYGHLPDNFITKKEAEAAGWVAKEGNLWEVAPGMSIGGSRFGNYEGQLPEEKGRIWYECDINFDGSYRGGERIVYSNDGLIYYTGDHYKSFEQLY